MCDQTHTPHQCQRHVHDAGDVVQHRAVRVQPQDRRGLHKRKRGPLDGSPKLSLDMSDSSDIKSAYSVPGPVLVAADAADRAGTEELSVNGDGRVV